MNIKKFTKETNLQDIGVYMITHKDTDIKYIGSTLGKYGFSGRWRAHLSGLLRGVGNRVLLNIYKKYGLSGFRFHILERITDTSIIRKRERYWIDYYDTYHHGANCTEETECAFIHFDRQPYTEEQRQMYQRTSPTKRKVYVYDREGNLLKEFPSTVACDKFFGLKKGRTNWIVNHPIRKINGLYPSYELKKWNPYKEELLKRKEIAKKIAKIRKEKGSYKVSENHKNKIRLGHKDSLKVNLYTLDNKLIKSFNSLNECDDFLKLTRGTTSKVLKGKAKTLKRKFIPKII